MTRHQPSRVAAGVLLALAAALPAPACRTQGPQVVLFFPPRGAIDEPLSSPPVAADVTVEVTHAEDRRDQPGVIGVERGLAGMVTARIRASNAGADWIAQAVRYELAQAGLRPLGAPVTGDAVDVDPAADADESADLAVELELLGTEAASGPRHPAAAVVVGRLRRDGRVLFSRRLRGSAPALDTGGVPIDPAESLALALRDALGPLVAAAVDAARELPSSAGGEPAGDAPAGADGAEAQAEPDAEGAPAARGDG